MLDAAGTLPSRLSRIGWVCVLVLGFLSAGFSPAQLGSDPDVLRQISDQCSFYGQAIHAACVNRYRDKLEYLFFQGNIAVPEKMEVGRQLLYSYGSSPADLSAFRAVAHRYAEYHDGKYPGIEEGGEAGAATASSGSSHAWLQFAEVDGECDIHGSLANSPCVLAHRPVLEELFYNSDLDLPDKIAIGRKLASSYSGSPEDQRAQELLSQRMSGYQQQAAKHAYSLSADMSSVVYGDPSASEKRRPPTLYTGGESAPSGGRSSRKGAQSNPPGSQSNPVRTAEVSSPPASTPAPTAGAPDSAASAELRSTPTNAAVANPSPVPAAPTAPTPVKTVVVSTPRPATPSSSTPAPGTTRGLLASSGTAVHIVPSGPSYALIIGIDQYPSFPKLHTAVDDAKAVDAELRQKFGFHTQLLLDGQADRMHIMTALSSFRRSLSPDSNLLIYYAGHGLHDHESDKVYWLPVDAAPDNSANWLQTDDITSEIRAIPARHVLIVADSCYAGGMTRDAEAVFTPMERSRFLEKVAAAKSRDLLSSGGDEPVADAGGAGGHSVFAAALLRGLDQMELDRFTAAELYSSFIRVIVAGNSDQTPEYNFIRNSGHDAGDFIFLRQTH